RWPSPSGRRTRRRYVARGSRSSTYVPPSSGAWRPGAARKAIVAVGHSILVIAYPLRARGVTYAELGGQVMSFVRTAACAASGTPVANVSGTGPDEVRWSRVLSATQPGLNRRRSTGAAGAD